MDGWTVARSTPELTHSSDSQTLPSSPFDDDQQNFK